jgi:sugar phosphate isomerase/epimerase
MKISAFPKCYIEDLSTSRTMTVFEWITMAKSLGADGLEMYVGFFTSFDDSYIDNVADAIHEAGFAMPMLCCSPDFTNPDPDQRKREIDKEAHLITVARRLAGAGVKGVTCRVLTGQRYPEVGRAEGITWFAEAVNILLPIARQYDVTLALENHYKDSFWKYPEFAQKQDVFLEALGAIQDKRYFGVQYDPSNAILAGDDPIALLEQVADRVVSMHASDRYLIEGASLDDLRQSDGTLGYSPSLRHGVVGKGLNDYDAIFRILSGVNYQGWISIEDGMNGMDEMRESISFLKEKRAVYFPE